MTASSFEKRVKRRISGREHPLFIVCSPGLKTVCRNEMLASGGDEKTLEITPGGIEVMGRLNDCFAFNLNLGSPSRILMRIDTFRADSFEKLEKKIAAIDWILYLPKNCRLNFRVTAQKSRLYHSDAIAQRCEKIISDQLQSEKGFISSGNCVSDQTIYIRADHDQFTISIDTTGELLFKRGIKTKVNKAPLRENLAYAMLSWAGFSFDDVLIDPMCGSGTFSLEAAMMKTRLPPGLFRSFAFESWPGFSSRAFAHLKHLAEKNCIAVPGTPIMASDIDEKALAALEQNISQHEFCRIISPSKTDFFSILPNRISPQKKGVVMLNPPYGKRLGKETNTRSFYREIGKKLAADFKGWRVGIIVPSRECKTFLDLKLKLNPIYHGGLDIFAGIGRL